MKLTMEISDELLEAVGTYAPANLPPEDLVRFALERFIQAGAARALAAMGGQAPGMQDVRRRRFDESEDS